MYVQTAKYCVVLALIDLENIAIKMGHVARRGWYVSKTYVGRSSLQEGYHSVLGKYLRRRDWLLGRDWSLETGRSRRDHGNNQK